MNHRNSIILRANQDSSQAISFKRFENEGKVMIYNIDKNRNCNLTCECQVSENNVDIIDCVFFPCAYGNIIAFGMADHSIIFKKENFNGESLQYETIEMENDDTDSSNSSQLPQFGSNLRISLHPPELNLGFISTDGIIHIFFIDYGNKIKLIPIRRYRNNEIFLWFNFNDNSSIWCATQNKIHKYALNSFDSKIEKILPTKLQLKNDESELKFIDASISPVKFENDERVAVLMSDGNVHIFLGNPGSQHPVSKIESEIENPLSVEWSPLGTRIAICSEVSSPKCYIESTYNVWNEIETSTK
ncbi:hypothetical protein TRFO_39800 [Tritrichomonas foetus]|uniref:Anaphase-promoting complex subunit 4 WD40 domain-containing protein n=1 Tax=Tritrichomonas foetus TaxID=1144522 RepID=A0A1J4J3K0_9EUKA|nr:hypothetical protein TRFO_39800 [Tritrichomonas foetus]|eukprot:OHS94032.1 hypothetical protein TRFO_39800 [Tritrichomonas foetus]